MGFKLVFGLLAISVVTGVFAYRGYDKSERHLMGVLDSVATRGKELTIAQCLDTVIDWSPHCEAIESLCEASIPRVMGTCLAARDRQAECVPFAGKAQDPRFVYAQCKAKGLPKSLEKPCGLAFQAIAAQCRSVADRGK